MKIRVRLAMWYFAITLSVVLIFSLVTYFGMKSLLFRALDGELYIVTDTIERSYDPFFDEFQDLFNLPKSINRYNQFYMLVYNAAGELVFATPITQRLSMQIPVPQDKSINGMTVSVNMSRDYPFFRPNDQGKLTFRLISRRLFYNGKPIGWIIVGFPIQRLLASMSNLLEVLVGVIILAVFLIAFGGYLLTRQALKPIYTITTKAKQISKSNLNERLEIQNKEDEIGQLAIVLNNLLERLEKSFNSQQLFLADAAHELKTPLSVLRAHWEAELNNEEISLDVKEKLVQDVETITRLTHLINNLILLSQTESVESNFDMVPVYLDEIVQEVVNDAAILAEMKSQELVIVELPRTYISGDRVRLYQLLFNLVENAVKYTPEEGKVWITLQVQDKWAILKVRDNGLGIPEDDLPHIFERFYRVDKDRARKTGGSGLGLSICKLIAESHRGVISVESTLAKGTVFMIKFPLYQKYLPETKKKNEVAEKGAVS